MISKKGEKSPTFFETASAWTTTPSWSFTNVRKARPWLLHSPPHCNLAGAPTTCLNSSLSQWDLSKSNALFLVLSPHTFSVTFALLVRHVPRILSPCHSWLFSLLFFLLWHFCSSPCAPLLPTPPSKRHVTRSFYLGSLFFSNLPCSLDNLFHA